MNWGTEEEGRRRAAWKDQGPGPSKVDAMLGSIGAVLHPLLDVHGRTVYTHGDHVPYLTHCNLSTTNVRTRPSHPLGARDDGYHEFRAKYVREVYGGFESVYDSAVRESKEGGELAMR